MSKILSKTIAKNRKKLITQIIANAQYVKTYDRETGQMVPLNDVEFIPKDFLMYSRARLTMNENGLCRFSLHSNNFTHFKVPDTIVNQVFKK